MARYARQAIVTKYLISHNTGKQRVKATAEAGSIILDWDYKLNDYGNHEAAALALVKKFGWDKNYPKPCEIVGGSLPGKDGGIYCWVDINTNEGK